SFHPVTDRILHIDFYQLFENKEITMEIPILYVGSSRGVKSGGVLRKNLRSLKVKALPANLPDFIEADITPLKVGNKLYITTLENKAYKFMHPDNTVVCLVRRSRAAVTEDEEEDEEVAVAETPVVEATQE